ncbi:hypothetical protein LPJ55_005255 [Coemansia sp. RSA 990]|nr:regulator of volume decrease after cellular swelling-domain-containing protein [Coemansia mojavensis]KAJ1739148.1 hypothetical protein LPJ68_004939 [Coemansia sp. RSA 1086]KAJ1869597.1 hypothetical protein LPJ55_005255 [Coemansia sp. RSA 990]KAJ2649565.1 hypothetical protein IWW40_003065 [Coemansia sp. RSA 1250]KAJ2667906.1 hypothetical protein IWW42_005604 [Coemansia sp. RSA 1085]
MAITVLEDFENVEDAYFTANSVSVECDPSSKYLSSDTSNGTVYLGEHQLVFHSKSPTFGFALDYKAIIIHAVSKEDPQPHLYCQLNEQFPDNASLEDDIVELRIYMDENQLDEMFAKLCECVASHPDSASEAELDDVQIIDSFDSSQFITSPEQLDQLTPQGQVSLFMN